MHGWHAADAKIDLSFKAFVCLSRSGTETIKYDHVTLQKQERKKIIIIL